MKVAVVVQRYGADINGGAEQHARYIAERLARHVQVEVLTTCAKDYITWRNEWPEGEERIHDVVVRRFPVIRERDPGEFGRASERVFGHLHSVKDELEWLDAEGPTSPALIDYITAHEAEFDFFIFFSFRYYHSYHGARAVSHKAILVPTAERDGALGLGVFAPVFRGVRALMYNSHEERALINAVSGNGDVPGVVVGVGSEIPAESNPGRFRQKFNFRDRFAIYIGRIDENKGCRELFEFFEHYSSAFVDSMHLVLIGNPIIPIPEHPRIHHLGFVTDQDKFDALAASELLVMPSYLESLSMVALEAWALGKPVLANAKCDVLRGQCMRSNGGLYYESFPEFFETLKTLDTSRGLGAALGRNGREFFQKHYTWPVIERKYLDMLDRLSKERPTRALEALPGWFARRRRSLPAADGIVKALPAGPVVEGAPMRHRTPQGPPQQRPVPPARDARRSPQPQRPPQEARPRTGPPAAKGGPDRQPSRPTGPGQPAPPQGADRRPVQRRRRRRPAPGNGQRPRGR